MPENGKTACQTTEKCRDFCQLQAKAIFRWLFYRQVILTIDVSLNNNKDNGKNMISPAKQELVDYARVLLIDDHPIVRQGLAQLINQESDLQICGEAGDPPEALQCIEMDQPDIALVDLSLGESSGLELIKDIRVQFPDLPVLVLSMHNELLYAERALRAGARGYIMKDEGTEKLVAAIRLVLGGDIYVSETMSARMLHKFVEGSPDEGSSPIDRLSDRELQVFELIGRGLGTREIAAKLHLSVKTIEAHRAHIKDKLDLKNSIELLQHAMRWIESGSV